MLKHSLLLGLVVLAAACSDGDDNTKRPLPQPVPTPTPAPQLDDPRPAPVPQVLPKAVSHASLPEDFGFQATYSSLPFAQTRFAEAESLANVSKYRIQVRKLENRDILDCRFNEKSLIKADLVLDGKVQKENPFTWISCYTLQARLLPVSNVKDLCDVYGCKEETISGMTITKVLGDQPLGIEKDSQLRVEDSQGLQMIRMTPGVPAASEFDYPSE